MANEVATLGLKIDSRDVLKADKALDEFTKVTKEAEKATDAFIDASKKKETETRRGTKSTKKAEKATESFARADKRYSIAANESATATKRLAKETRKQASSANDSANATTRQKTATQSLTTSMKAAGTAAIAYIAAVSVGKIAGFADEFTGMQNKLKQVTDGTVELNTVTNALFSTAEKTRSSIKSTTTLYSRLALASSELGLSQADLVGLTSTINKSFALSGATAEEAGAAITQLSQGLASGALRGDEFNSVAEQAPGIMRAIAKETNKSIGELREFAATGGITAEIVVSALQSASEKIDQDFSKSVSTFAQSMESVENGFIRWAGESENLTLAMTGAGQVVEVLADAAIFLLDGVLMVGRGIFELDKLMISTVNSTGLLTDAFNFIGEISTDISNNWQQGIIAGLGLLTNGFLHAGEAIAGPFVLAFSAVDTVILDTVDSVLQAAAVLGQFGLISQETVATLELMQANTGSVKDKMDEFHTSFAESRAEVDSFVSSANEHLDWTIKQKKATDLLTVSTEKSAKAKKKDAKATKESVKELEKALKETKALNKEFKITSSTDPFGALANGLQSFADKEQQYHDQRLDNEFAIADAKRQGLNIEHELIAENARLAANQTQDRLGQVSQIATSISAGFDEGSTAAKAFEIAAASAATAQALVAIATQGLGDPYTAFARIAAMISTMSSLGIAVSGGGGGGGSSASLSETAQASQGTGSVFGDPLAKAGSLGTAFERLEDINLQQQNELRGIFDEMVQLNNNISGLTGVLVRSFGNFTGAGAAQGANLEGSASGDFAREMNDQLSGQLGEFLGDELVSVFDLSIGKQFADFANALGDSALGKITDGLFGSTKKSLVDSGILIADQTYGALIEGIDTGTFAVIKTKKKKNFRTKTSFDLVTGELDEGTANQLQLVFENIGGTIQGAVDLLGIDTANSIEDFAISVGRISLQGLSGSEIQSELEAVFSNQANLMAEFLVPELMAFQVVGEETFDTLVRLAIQVSQFNGLVDSLNLNFSATGLGAVELIDSLTTMAGGTEKLNDSLTTYYENFFTASERQENLTNSLTDAMAELGLELPATREGFRSIVEALDLTTESGQEAFITLTQFSESANDVFEAFEKGTEFLSGLQKEIDRFGVSGAALDLLELEDWRDEQLLIATETGTGLAQIEELYGLQRQLILETQLEQQNAALIAANEALLAEMMAQMVSATDGAFGALGTAIDAERSAIDEAFNTSVDARKSALSSELEQIKASASAQTSAIKATEKARTDATKLALSAAKDGLSAISKELGGIVSALDKLRATTTPQKVLRAEALGVLQGALASGNLSGTGEAAGIAANINASEFASASEFAREIGVTSGVLSQLEKSGVKQENIAEQTIEALNTTITQIKDSSALEVAASKFNTGMQIAVAQTRADADIAMLTEQHISDTERLDGILENAQSQLDTLRGIDNSVLSVADALSSLAFAISNEASAGPFDNDRLAPIQPSGNAARSSNTEFIGPTNAVSSTQQNALLTRQEMLAEMKALRAEVHELKNTNVAVVKNTLKSSKILERWDGNGIPEERT